MKVKDILEKKGSQVWTINENQTVYESLGILVTQKIGALVVLNSQNGIAGIISERDIILKCHKNLKQIESSQVSQVMTRNVIIATPEDELEYIMGIMTNNRIRHIPVVSEGKLKGIISIGDVVKAHIQDKEYENRYLKDYLFGGR